MGRVKSRRTSIGIFFLVSAVLLPGCSMNSRGRVTQEDLPEELSLKADRTSLQSLRSDVPEEIKIANDEKAYFAELFGDPTRPPSKVRDQFRRDIRRIRDRFEKINRKTRETFGSNERKSRETFLENLKREREDWSRSKHDQKENSRFYSDMDGKRRDYFANEREKREDFESTHRQARRDFDDYTRSRQNDFEEHFRNYSRQHADDQRLKAQQQHRSGPATTPLQSVDQVTARVISPEEAAQAQRFKKDLEDFSQAADGQVKTYLKSGSGGP